MPITTRAEVFAAPARVNVPLEDYSRPVTGLRVQLFGGSGWRSGLIAVTEPGVNEAGSYTVLLAQEDDWWTWRVQVKTQGATTPRPRNCRWFPVWAVAVEGAAALLPEDAAPTG